MKTKYAIYCVLMTLAVFSTPISAEHNISGDVNADGRITTADSLLALRMAVGSAALEMERADVNADGTANSLDALMVLTMAQQTQVCVNSPEVVSGTFEVTIDIHNVADLDSGQFDLSFDPGVVNVTAVHDGNIGGRDVPVESWDFVDAATIRVLFNLPGVSGVSGRGQIATISFEVTGSQGDSCVLDISDGWLFDTGANEISALWTDCEMTIGGHAPVNQVRNVNTGEIFSFIQSAIDDPDTLDGHVIEVGDGVYRENVKVTKSLTIRSESGSANCVIQGSKDNHVVEITVDYVSICGFTVTTSPESEFAGAGISIDDAGYCNVSDNNACSNNSIGICLWHSSNNSISSNNCSSNRGAGIRLYGSSNNKLTGNVMFGNGIFIGSDSLIDYTHEIDESNTVNGKPVYYRKDIGSGRIPEGAGQVILVNCKDILVEDQELNNASVGVDVVFSTNVAIRNNNCSNNRDGGIRLLYSSNNSISNNDCSNNRAGGIYLYGSCNSSISNNNCSNNRYGICLDDSCNNSISSNNCSNNRYGICLDDSCNNSISENNCSNNEWSGIRLSYSSNNKLTGNVMFGNGIFIWSDSLIDYTHEIDESNTVNGKPVYYRKDIGSGRIPEGAGQVILVNCKDILVEDQELNDASVGIGVFFSSNIAIRNNNCSNNRYGIRLGGSSNNSISSNTCSTNVYGIRLDGSSNNSISSNTCSTNVYGIRLDGSSNTSISNNSCSTNVYGIRLGDSGNNRISSNNCSNNRDDGIRLGDSSNNKLTGNVMFGNGIFIWSDSLIDYTHEIDESNTVNGKPVYYRKDIGSGRIPEGAGQVILVNCKDILVEDQELNDASVGVEVAFSTNITIRNNNCSNNRYGIRLDGSSNNSISSNNCSNNRDGGICFEYSYSNVIYLNNFLNDDDNVNSRSSANLWNSTSKINYTYRGKTFVNYLGNYWDDYEGSDSDKDGIGDSHHRINSDRDDYPLIAPFEAYITSGESTAQVCVDTPEVMSGTFDVAIDIHNVVDLDSGQFDLTFDPGVVNVTGVNDGNIDGTTVPIACWYFMDADTIRVIFKPDGAGGVSGSGYVAGIDFEVTGSPGDSCVLDISDGKLTDTKGDGIPAIWVDAAVTIRVPVTVHAPPVVSGAFEVTIDIENVTDLDSGQFDLSFNSSVVNVTAVHDGNMDGRQVPVESWDFVDAATIRVLFNLPGVDGVSGSGQIATISFEVTGSSGDSCALDISNGGLFDTGAEVIPAIWNDCEVPIGVPVTVNAPPVVSGAFEVTIDIENVTDLGCGQFDLFFDSSVVNVTGVNAGNISGTAVLIDLWAFMGADTIRVLFNLPGFTGVSGSGHVATISFETTGSGGYSVLGISDGVLVDNSMYADTIPAIWTHDVIISGENTPVNRVHNLNTGEDFIFIQDAIDDPDTSDEHTIAVDDGVYRENVRVTKSLTIRSMNGSANCVIQDARRNDYLNDVVKITADCVRINGFTLERLPEPAPYGVGIHLYASFCNVSGNNCSNNAIGICLDDSSDNIISGNNCSNNWWAGICLYESCNNVAYLNNFINGGDNVESMSSPNIWSSPSKLNYTYEGRDYTNYLGNYWDDYTGNDSNNDGIGESPYYICPNEDNHPLMMPIENYFVETENVQEPKEV